MGTPSKSELEKLLAIDIQTPDQYTQALQRAEAMQQMGLIESFVETIPTEIQAEVSIYANPTLTEEQKQQKLLELQTTKSSGQTSAFGGFEETSVPPQKNVSLLGQDLGFGIGGVAAPLEAESAFQDTLKILSQSYARQQTIGEERARLEQPTIVDARESLRQNLTQHFAEVPDTDRNSMIDASLSMFDHLKKTNPELSQTEIHNLAVTELNDLLTGKVGALSPEQAEKIDPRTKTKYQGSGDLDLLARAFDWQKRTGTDLPMYTEAQLVFLQSQQDKKYSSKINEIQTQFKTDPVQAKGLSNVSMAVIKVGPGDYAYVPTQVYNYLKDNPLGGVVYSAERDNEIIKAINEGNVSVKDQFNEFVRRDLTNNRRAKEALARVKAYEELGDPDWKQSLDKRNAVLENIKYYDDAGFFQDTTALGGTTETAVSWVLRSAFSPLSAVAAVGTEALNVVGGGAIGLGAEAAEAIGVLPELPEGESYMDPQYTKRIRERERPELYKEYGRLGEIADNIARFKGFTGEGVAIADEMNLEGLAKWGTLGGYFITDLADPTFDIASGTIQGFNAYNKSLQAHKQLFGAANYGEALKIAKKAAKEEVPLLNNSLKMYRRMTGKPAPTNLQSGDVILSMRGNLARNLNAERLANQGKNIDQIIEAGLGDTQYARLLQKNADNPTNASLQFRKLLMENDETAKMLKSYDETVDVVRRATSGYDYFDELSKIENQLKGTQNLVDFKGAKQAIQAAIRHSEIGVGVNALRNVDQLYATPILLRTMPDLKGLDNAAWITRNTIVHRKRVPRILALAAQSDIGQAFSVVTKGLDNSIVATRPAREIPYDIFGTGQRAVQGETSAAYDLTNLNYNEMNALGHALDQVDISPSLKNNINNSLDKRLLFVDDYNKILEANRDMVARFDDGSVTIDDINRMSRDNASRLIEASGTVGRMGAMSPVVSRQISETMDRTAYQGRKQLAEQLNKPTLPTQSTLNFEQTRLMNEYNGQMGTFTIRTEQMYNRLLQNDQNILSQFLNVVPNRELLPQEVMGLMIVGERQLDDLGKSTQVDSLVQSTTFLVNNLFIRKTDIPKLKQTFSQANKMIGLDELSSETLWNGHGLLYLEQQMQKFSSNVINDPLLYWDEIKKLVDDFNDAIQNPNNRLRTVDVQTEKGIEKITQPIVGDTLDASNVLAVTDELMQSKVGNFTVATHFAAESQRTIGRLLIQNIGDDLGKFAVQELIPGTRFTQKNLEAMVQDAALELYSKGNVDQARMQSIFVRSSLDNTNINPLNPEPGVKRLLKQFYKEQNAAAREINKTAATQQKTQLSKTMSQLSKTLDDEQKAIVQATKRATKTQVSSLKRTLKTDMKAIKKQFPLAKRETKAARDLRTARDKTVKELRKKRKNAEGLVPKTSRGQERKEKLLRTIDLGIDSANASYKAQRKALVNKGGQKAVLTEDYIQAVKAAEQELVTFQRQATEQLEAQKEAYKIEKQRKLDAEEQLLKSQTPPPQTIVGEDQLNALVKQRPDESLTDYLNRLSVTGEAEILLLADEAQRLSNTNTTELFNVAIDQAEIVLRNNNLLTRKGTVQSMEESIETLFANEGYARAIIGKDRFAQMKQVFGQGNIQYKRAIVDAVIKTPDTFKYVKKSLDFINQFLYVSLLGWRPASHVRNTSTAATIVYQTTGELLGVRDISRGIGVVANGQSINARNYGKIVVRTADGMAYTNGDIFKILQESGVRNQFQFIESQLSDGSAFVKELNRMKQNNLSDYAYNFLRGMKKWIVDKPLYLQTQEDFIFRAGVLTKALEDGRSVEEAASLARRSMFDYSDMPREWNRAARSVLVFSSFTFQNIKQGLLSLSRPSSLIRYGKMLRAVQSTNTLLRANNDNKQLPYQMYYPTFAQQRIVYEINTYNDRTSFLMAPPIPAIDSFVAITSFFIGAFRGVQAIGGKEVDPFVPIINLIQPLYKEILPFERKYEASNAKPELVTFLSLPTQAKTPVERAELLERFAGGVVNPKPAKPNDKNAIDGYVYPLSKEQRKNLYHGTVYRMLTLTGLNAQVMDYVRLFSPEGTTQANQDFATRLGSYFGIYSLSQATPKNVQQQRNMRNILRQLDKIKKGQEDLTEAAIIRDQFLIQDTKEE